MSRAKMSEMKKNLDFLLEISLVLKTKSCINLEGFFLCCRAFHSHIQVIHSLKWYYVTIFRLILHRLAQCLFHIHTTNTIDLYLCIRVCLIFNGMLMSLHLRHIIITIWLKFKRDTKENKNTLPWCILYIGG